MNYDFHKDTFYKDYFKIIMKNNFLKGVTKKTFQHKNILKTINIKL